MSPYLDLVTAVEPIREPYAVSPRRDGLPHEGLPRGQALRWSEVAKVLDALLKEGVKERDGLRAAYRGVDKERYPESTVLQAAERGVRLLVELRTRLVKEYGVGGERFVPVERVVREADRLTKGLPGQAVRERGLMERAVQRVMGREVTGRGREFER